MSRQCAQTREHAAHFQTISRAIQRQMPALLGLTQQLWYMAEPSGQEFNTSRRIQGFLADNGFTVRASASELPTAAIATFGNGSLVVGLSVEIDALPIPLDGRPINHACGHNVAATTTLACALALKEVAGTIGLTVCVQIDPEEEGRGGKPKKLEAGDYDGLHLYMAPHMGGHNWEELPSIGNQPYEVRMVGVSSHDASARERGNPVKPGFETFNERLKQLELGYNVEPGTVINQQGGPYFPGQANVISAVGIQQVMVRNASTSALSSDVMAKVERGAKHSGATFDLGVVGRRLAPMYAGPRTDDTLMDLFKESVDSAPDIKRTFRPAPLTAKPSSTDNWNVAHAIPTIHPMLAINEAEAELPLHTVEMAIAANPERNTKGISRAIVEGGMAFALTGARIAVDPAARSRFTARNFSARDTLAGDRPEWMSAFPGWDKPEILNEGIGVDLQLLSAAMDSKSPVFRIP